MYESHYIAGNSIPVNKQNGSTCGDEYVCKCPKHQCSNKQTCSKFRYQSCIFCRVLNIPANIMKQDKTG